MMWKKTVVTPLITEKIKPPTIYCLKSEHFYKKAIDQIGSHLMENRKRVAGNA